MPEKILLVEDDMNTGDYIANGLTEEGFTVDRTDNGRDGFFLASGSSYGAVILDRMLPAMDGMAMLGALRAAAIETPILMLSAMGTPDDRIAGLNAGSDDYLVKPFVFGELLARVRVLTRKRFASRMPETWLACDDLHMDLLSRKVTRGDRPIELQPREFRLLEHLLRHAEQVITRTMLLENVWDYHFDPGTNVIDVHLSKLRRKIDCDGDNPLLHTIRGAGYRLGRRG